MSDHEFEKRVKQKMDELRFSPSDAVWNGVQREIGKGRSNRRGWLWIPAMLVAFSVTGYFFMNNNASDKTLLSNKTETNKQAPESNHSPDQQQSHSDPTTPQNALPHNNQGDLSSAEPGTVVSAAPSAPNPFPENPDSDNARSGNQSSLKKSSGNPLSGDQASGNQPSGNAASAGHTSANPTSGNPASGNPASGNPTSANPTSGNPASGNLASGNLISGNPASGSDNDKAIAVNSIAGRKGSENKKLSTAKEFQEKQILENQILEKQIKEKQILQKQRPEKQIQQGDPVIANSKPGNDLAQKTPDNDRSKTNELAAVGANNTKDEESRGHKSENVKSENVKSSEDKFKEDKSKVDESKDDKSKEDKSKEDKDDIVKNDKAGLAAPDSLSETTAMTSSVPAIASSKTAKEKSAASKNWSWGISASGGVSKLSDGKITDAFKSSENFDAALATQAPSNNSFVFRPSPAGVPPPKPSKVRPGVYFSVGGFVKKQISKKFAISAGLQYSQHNNIIHTGNRVDSSQLVNNGAQIMNVARYYRAAETSRFSNKYHFIELPVTLHTQLNKGDRSPLIWNLGASVGQLVGSNSLVFDSGTGVYYKDKSKYNKTQFSMSTGFSFGLFSGSATPLWIGPSVRYHNSRLFIAEMKDEKHLFSASLDLRMFLNKK